MSVDTKDRITVDKDVFQALSLVTEGAQVFELRVITSTWQKTISGYYDDVRLAARDAARLSGTVPAVYVVLNPVAPALLARAHNRMVDKAKSTTSDNDILNRLWLPLDFDPERPAGISSTDSEHEAAIERADRCKLYLTSLGFPEPILASSGNGAHLLYRIDLPNDQKAHRLIEKCLEALDFLFSDGEVKVDRTTSNAARIWKVYGTKVCKGDSMPERPHRVARIIEAPVFPEVVTPELLTSLCSVLPQEPATTHQNGHSQYNGRVFELPQWVAKLNLSVAREGSWNGGHKWVLDTCPWNSQHTDNSAFIVQHTSGAIAAGCHHNGCAGNGWKELRTLYEGPRTERPPGPVPHYEQPAHNDIPPQHSAPKLDWPEPPGEAAYHGLAGELVRAIDPYTEADQVAVLGTILTFYGNAVGRGPHGVVGAVRHEPRINLALVGRSSKARKGDSIAPPRALFDLADHEWASSRINSGLTSGEGLIWAVRDAIERTERVKGVPGAFETVTVDEGVRDKRLLVIEPEFARVLQAMSRQGNTLNSVIRDAWDRGSLQTMTKGSPAKATDAHVSIIGHITVEELRRELTDTDAANGFGNRFIWLAVKRSKQLPEPEPFSGDMVIDLVDRLAGSLQRARSMGLIVRDADAKVLWKRVYDDLSAERDGLSWAVLARAEAQVLRLSLLYALIDGSHLIRVPHLQAALELWAYSERSVLHVFGDATGDHVADTIYSALKRRGCMTRTDISGLFGRNQAADRISHALRLLEDLGKARMTRDDSSPGRPIELWWPVQSDTSGG